MLALPHACSRRERSCLIGASVVVRRRVSVGARPRVSVGVIGVWARERSCPRQVRPRVGKCAHAPPHNYAHLNRIRDAIVIAHASAWRVRACVRACTLVCIHAHRVDKKLFVYRRRIQRPLAYTYTGYVQGIYEGRIRDRYEAYMKGGIHVRHTSRSACRGAAPCLPSPHPTCPRLYI